MSEEIRVLVLADDPLVRAGLAALLAEEPGIRVAGQEPSPAVLPALAAVYAPDAVVWDLGWDATGVIPLLEEAASEGPPIVALLPDGTHAAEAMAAGARGAVLRSRPVAAIAAALRAVLHGLTVRDPELGAGAGPGAATELLTPRELEVLRLLSRGLPNKAIADALGVSEHTAKFHVASIMGKLGAQSRTEAVVLATRAGLIPL